MDNIQLFALQQGATGYSGYRELDLYQEEPIKITKSVQSLEDPQATTSNFSRTFRVPHTPTNGKYFKAVFNVNSTDFDARQKANAYITVNGSTFMDGNIRINQIFRGDATGKIEYELIFMGETSTFASVVAPRELSELDFSNYTHTVNFFQLNKSWERKLFNGDIVYPLAEWGYSYTNDVPDQSTLSKFDNNVSLYGFTSSSHPLSVEQFKPAVRAKVVWDKIFEEAGFTYESQFLDDSWFQNLYLISTNEALPTQRTNSDFEAQQSFQQFGQVNVGDKIKLNFPSVVTNNGNAWIPNASKFIAPFTGAPYFFTLKDCVFQFTANPPPYQFSPYSLNIQFYLYVNGVQAAIQTGSISYLSSTGTQIGYVENYTGANEVLLSANLQEGDEVEVYVAVPPGQAGFTFELLAGTLIGETPNTVNPAGLMPANYKQIDFIKGINDRFKLIWEPDPDNPKNFFIEPWVDWVAQGSQKDWTDKLNNDKDYSITPTFYTQPREWIFKDAEESDIYNFSYIQEFKETFGERKQDSGIEVITGNKELKSIFAPVPLAPIGNSKDFLIPHFAKDTETQRQPIQVKPRLMFYNGVQDAPLTWYLENDFGTPIAYNDYPLFSQFDRYPFDDLAFDLNWKNVKQFWDVADTPLVGSGRTPRDAYSLYWESWYNDTFSSSSRVFEGTFVLDYDDITKIRFNDLIFVKDAWYMPLEISDYVLGARSEVKCKLLKLGTIGINIDTTGPGSGLQTYSFTGICYGETLCEAYCCQGFAQYTLYSDQSSLSSSYRLWFDKNLTIPAPIGFWSDGTDVYQVGVQGFITSVGTGASCTCFPLVVSSNACTSSNFCTAVCCSSYPTPIYYDGTSLDTSTVAFSSAGYSVLIPDNWYRESGGQAVKIGKDGYTIVQVGNSVACNCNILSDAKVLGIGSGVTGACCGEGATGALGLNEVYYDKPTFVSSTNFYQDPFGDFPLGAVDSVYISDGVSTVDISGATAGASGACPSSATVYDICPGRTEIVEVLQENAEGVVTELLTYNEISFDNSNWINNGLQISSGSTFSDTFNPKWSPGSFFRFQVIVPALYGGSVQYRVIKNGSTIDAGEESSPFYTPSYGPVGEDTYNIILEWIP